MNDLAPISPTESPTPQKRRAGSVQCWVYFIQPEDGGLIKIGNAQWPPARLTEFQMGCPLKLKIIAKLPGNIRHEKMLHRRFKLHRRHGEWFSPHEELLAFIAGLKAECSPFSYYSDEEVEEMYRPPKPPQTAVRPRDFDGFTTSILSDGTIEYTPIA